MKMTVGELMKRLSVWPEDFELTFGSSWGSPDGMPFEFYRLKQRGEKLLQIELQDMYDEDEWLARRRGES